MRSALIDQRLEAIAGPPQIQIVEPEESTHVYFDRPDPTGDLTLICAFDSLNLDSGWNVIAGLNNTALGRATLRSWGAGSTSVQSFVNIPEGGSTNTGAVIAGGREPGRRHVGAFRLTTGDEPDDLLQDFWVDDQYNFRHDLRWGTGVPSQNLSAIVGASQAALWTGAWNRALSDDEVDLVMKHLEARYVNG